MGFFKWFSGKKNTLSASSPMLLPAPIEVETILKDVLREIDQEKKDNELVLLYDPNLKNYIKNCFKYIVKEHNTIESFCVSHTNIGLAEKHFSTFRKIFEAIASSIGLKIERNGQYIWIESKNVKAFLKKINYQTIDIDEKIRGLLSSGPYR